MNTGCRLLWGCLLWGSVALPLCAQTDDFHNRYESFRQQTEKKYGEFRRQCNVKYAEFMEDAWRSFKGLPPRPLPLDENPVPPVFFPEGEKDQRPEDRQLPVVELLPGIVPLPQPQPVEPVREEPEPSDEYHVFRFYGTEGKVRLHATHRFQLPDCTESEVAGAWRHCAEDGLDNVIRDCLELRLRYKLCDWAYLQMLEELASSFLGKNTNEATLLAGFLYCQSGYKMRLARGASKLYLLIACRHTIYGQPYFRIDGEDYYPLHCEEEDLNICQASYPKEQPLSLWITGSPKLAVSVGGSRTLKSSRYPEMQATVNGNKNLIDFYNDYPVSEVDDNFMTRWAMYANTPLAEEIKASLYPSLQKVIQEKSSHEAVNMLLNFVQTAFVYEYDDKVWGNDRAFFAEETLYYPYCDCEDRSILFSRLVRDLLGLDVVLVYYPGHLATAVAFPEDSQGDYLMLDGRKFTVCDPTYIGAPAGRTMPGMDNSGAKVMKLQ